MVSYIFTQAADLPVSGNAADIAHRGKPVDLNQLRPGDLVFFNTRHKPFSHVGIYIGNDRFVHAPSEAGLARVRTDSLKNQYFASRLEAARSLLD
jgi:cell wall-associated NlpC family hydrolase